jgi:HEAT repeat protein
MKDEPKFEGRTASFWVAQLDDHSDAFRKRATEVLDIMGHAAIQYMVKGLDHDIPDVRQQCRTILARHGVSALPYLLAVVSDPNVSSRQRDWAWDTIERMYSRAVPPMIAMLESRDSEDRATAAMALGRLGVHAQEAIPALTERLRDSDAEVRENAAWTLIRLGSRVDEGPERSTNFGDYERELAAWERLRERVLTDKYMKLVADASKDENPKVRLAAAKIIGRARWSHPTAGRALQVLRQDGEPEVTEAASIAAKRLGGRM